MEGKKSRYLGGLYNVTPLASSHGNCRNARANLPLSSLLTCHFVVPDSLVFDISRSSDRYRVTFLSAIYRRPGASVEIARMRLYVVWRIRSIRAHSLSLSLCFFLSSSFFALRCFLFSIPNTSPLSLSLFTSFSFPLSLFSIISVKGPMLFGRLVFQQR